jgi:hypothetical protein
MAYNVATLVATFVARDGPLQSALARVRGALAGTFGAIKRVSGATVTPADAGNAVTAVAGISAAVGGLHAQILGLGGLSVSSLLGLGSVAGLVAGVGSVIRQFMNLHDQMIQVGAQFESRGLDAEKATGEFYALSDSIARTGQVSTETARSLALTAIQKGPDPTNFERTTKAALAISAATGMSAQRAMQMVNLGEENYHNYQRMLRAAGLQVRQGASYAEIMARVNKLIDVGTGAQERMQKTFTQRIQGLHNSFFSLRQSIGAAIGPGFESALTGVIGSVQNVIDRVKTWVDANREVLAEISGVITKVVLFAGTALAAAGTVAIVTRALSAFRVASIALSAAQGVLRVATMGVGVAIRGALAATGVGMLLVLAAGVLQATGAFEKLTDTTKSFGDRVRAVVAPIISWWEPVWTWLRVEGTVAMEALRKGWDNLAANFQQLGVEVMDVVNSVVNWWGYHFGALAPETGGIVGAISAMWKNFVGELAVLGLRIRLTFAQVVLVWKSIPGIVSWIWDTFVAFLAWLSYDFPSKWAEALMVQVDAIKLFGRAVVGVFQGIWNVIKGGRFSDAFQGIHEEFEKLKNRAAGIFKDFKPPKLELYMDQEYLKKTKGLQAELDAARAKAIEEQEGRRKELYEQFAKDKDKHDDKKREKEKLELKGGFLPQRGFGDLMGVWKKMQEQAAGTMSPQVDLAKKSLAQHQDTNKHLAVIREQTRVRQGDGDKPVIPT